MVFHSQFNKKPHLNVTSNCCGLILVPFRTQFRGAVTQNLIHEELDEDIIDEALKVFRVMSMLRRWDVQGHADKILVYALLWIQECLSVCLECNHNVPVIKQQLAELAASRVPGPGNPEGFNLSRMFAPPQTEREYYIISLYLRQLREEIVHRLMPLIYHPEKKNSASFAGAGGSGNNSGNAFGSGSGNGSGSARGAMVPDKWWFQYAKKKFLGMTLWK